MSAPQDNESAKYPFGLTADVWDNYMKYRPNYPDSMWNEWLDYHRGPLATAHDLGTGCGIGAAKLLTAARARGQPIKNMILSDPTDTNIQTTKDFLVGQNHFAGTEFTFHQQPGENQFLPPGSVDLVIACECLHWTEIDKAIAAMHASLRPGGTAAAVFYALPSLRILNNDAAQAAWAKIAAERAAKREAEPRILSPRVQPRQLGMGLNFVPMDKALWEDVVRTWINFPNGKTEWSSLNPEHAALNPKSWAQAPSMIDPKTDTLRWVDDHDGWGLRECTIEEIKGILSTMIMFADIPMDGEAWKELESAVKEGGGTVHVVWPATTLLGRKKA